MQHISWIEKETTQLNVMDEPGTDQSMKRMLAEITEQFHTVARGRNPLLDLRKVAFVKFNNQSRLPTKKTVTHKTAQGLPSRPKPQNFRPKTSSTLNCGVKAQSAV